MSIKEIPSLLKDTFREWMDDKALSMGAALAYYSIFSITPLLLIAIACAGLIFGPKAAQGEIVKEISSTVGPSAGHAIQSMLKDAHQNSSAGIWATVAGFITLLVGATGVFGQLQNSLNTIWKVTPRPGRGIWGVIHDRFLSLTMVFGTGFLLLVSLIISAVVTALARLWTPAGMPGGAAMWIVTNNLVSFAVVALLFAMIFKFLPDVEVNWTEVWLGSVTTAVLFTVGKYLLGLYLGRESVTSSYGAAGSLVLMLLWVYYSSLILMFGAELTRVYAENYGGGIRVAENALPLTRAELARQGLPRTQDVESAARADTQPNGPRDAHASKAG